MSSSRYWELTVEVPEEASEGVTNLVWELGALGVVEEEAPGRPPRLRAFFPKTVFARALEESVREYLAGLRELGFPGAGEPSVIALEPGRAFGTGQHPSTLGCLERLESLIVRTAPRRLIDLGTGSGVLAIAAARLGVGQVLAVDDDPDAVASAMANAARNRVCDRVRCVLGDAGALADSAAPLVVANLLTTAHLRLAPRYARYVAPGGALVLGGVL